MAAPPVTFERIIDRARDFIESTGRAPSKIYMTEKEMEELERDLRGNGFIEPLVRVRQGSQIDGMTVMRTALPGLRIESEDMMSTLEVFGPQTNEALWATKWETVRRRAGKLAAPLVINGRKVPQPLSEPPVGPYYHVDFESPSGYSPSYWMGEDDDRRRLALGICHKPPEAARAHFEALMSFTTEGGNHAG